MSEFNIDTVTVIHICTIVNTELYILYRCLLLAQEEQSYIEVSC